MFGILFALLTVMFVGFKIVGVIAWSWFWVFSPIWIAFLLWLALSGVIVAFYAWLYGIFR